MTSKIILVPSMISITNGVITTSQGSCNIVPKLISTTQTIQYTTTGTGGQSYPNNQMISIGPGVVYDTASQGSLYLDPLSDHFEWYGFDQASRWKNTYSFTFYDLEDRMTNMHELSPLIEDRLTDIVLVQSNGSRAWTMHFRSLIDREIMLDIMAQFQPVPIKLTTFPKDLVGSEWTKFTYEVTDWCAVTLKEKYSVISSEHVLNGKFRSDSDAALFKLKWTYA